MDHTQEKLPQLNIKDQISILCRPMVLFIVDFPNYKIFGHFDKKLKNISICQFNQRILLYIFSCASIVREIVCIREICFQHFLVLNMIIFSKKMCCNNAIAIHLLISICQNCVNCLLSASKA